MLACVSLCTVLVVGFVAAVNLAIPPLAAGSLHPSPTQLLWIVDSYVVLFACLVIPAGALGDRAGRKGVLQAGLLLLAVGALVSAAAGNVAVMLAGRALAGTGAACVLPNALAVLLHATEPARHSRAIAVWAAMTGLGGLLGNVGGGALLTAGSWRLLFAAVAPLGVLCAVWVAVAAPRGPRGHRDLAPRAAALLTLATLALLLGVIQGPEQGWGSAVVLGAFGCSAVLFGLWAVGELRAPHPLLDPRLFAVPALRAACLGMLVVFFGMFGFFYLNASLMQYGRGFSVLRTGLAVMPMSAPLLLGSRHVPALVARWGDRVVLTASFAVSGLGLLGLAAALDEGYPLYALWLFVLGCGIALALPTLTAAIANALPREQAGVAGGLQATTRELGSALGVAVIGTVLTARFVHTLPERAPGAVRPGHVPGGVAEALAAAPGEHGAVVGAYTASADTALKVAALVVLGAGTLVVTEMSWAARRVRRAAG
ncbi:integral membrane transport protein [Streptomyces griseoaurantiacus M045]|uniref:Integral membrane transport protein n=1 Tax=Streptomyces griseoaurantiacus M045 TaxID=996637 RepID=F3NH54_9ACTN|nr:integral membrane transport protein [Streptomyces griseoaurantiacus M045]